MDVLDAAAVRRRVGSTVVIGSRVSVVHIAVTDPIGLKEGVKT